MTANEVQELRAAIDRATAQDAPLHSVLHLLVDHLSAVASSVSHEAQALAQAAQPEENYHAN